jgi:hypothetical protein
MIVLLPLLLMLFVVTALRGETVILMLPMLLMLMVGVVYVMIAMRDGTERKTKKDPSIRVLPSTFLGRQMYSALRTPGPKRSQSSSSRAARSRRFPWRAEKGPGGAHLHHRPER